MRSAQHTLCALLSVLASALPALRAEAQIGLPSVRLPQPLTAPLVPPLQATTGQLSATSNTLATLRRAAAQRLLRDNPALLEADPAGQPMLRGQLVGLNLSSADLGQIEAAGFSIGAQQALAPLDLTVVTLQAPDGVSTRRALQRLRALLPQASFDFDHVYQQTGAATPDTDPAEGRPSTPVSTVPGAGAVRIGLIDGGVQRSHVVLHAAAVVSWGCGGESHPSSHGTAVASLLVGDAPPFKGAAPGAALYAADVYCGQPTGGSVDAIAQAFGWLAAQAVPVINVSLVGPDNRVLSRVVRQLIEHGHLIVAAVGNDGPAAPPLYPAAYAGVVGVTAVDARHHVLLEAGRGPQVLFAAPGADLAAAALPGGYQTVRGTSFASPLVAGLLALRLTAPDPALAPQALASLAHDALPGGERRDPVLGYGRVAEQLAVQPAAVHADAVMQQ